jgi:hypothetical protein
MGGGWMSRMSITVENFHASCRALSALREWQCKRKKKGDIWKKEKKETQKISRLAGVSARLVCLRTDKSKSRWERYVRQRSRTCKLSTDVGYRFALNMETENIFETSEIHHTLHWRIYTEILSILTIDNHERLEYSLSDTYKYVYIKIWNNSLFYNSKKNVLSKSVYWLNVHAIIFRIWLRIQKFVPSRW